MKVLEQRNIFLSSETNVNGNGYDFSCSFPQPAFATQYPYQIRLTLQQFVMKRDWYNINSTNNIFYMYSDNPGDGGAVNYYPIVLEQGNYRTIAEFLAMLRIAIDNILAFGSSGGTIPIPFDYTYNINPNLTPPPRVNITYETSVTYPGVLPPLSYGATGDRKMLIDFQQGGAGWNYPGTHFGFFSLQVRNPSKDVLQNLLPQTVPPFAYSSSLFPTWACFQDTHELLGGDCTRVAKYNDVFLQNPSFPNPEPATPTPQEFFQSKYPVQLSSIESLYLRTTMINNNYQTPSFDASNIIEGQIQPSQIFARIPIANSDLVNIGAKTFPNHYTNLIWDDTGGGLFTLIIDAQHLDTGRFYLTDDKGRLLPYVGPTTQQTTYGNGNFKMTLKFEVIDWEVAPYISRQPSSVIPVVDEIVNNTGAIRKHNAKRLKDKNLSTSGIV